MDCLKLIYHSDKTLPKAIDHLGSGMWISYTDGEAIQHLHYLPDKKPRFFSPWRSIMKSKFFITLTACVGSEQGTIIRIWASG